VRGYDRLPRKACQPCSGLGLAIVQAIAQPHRRLRLPCPLRPGLAAQGNWCFFARGLIACTAVARHGVCKPQTVRDRSGICGASGGK
jgi:hypothetical protein